MVDVEIHIVRPQIEKALVQHPTDVLLTADSRCDLLVGAGEELGILMVNGNVGTGVAVAGAFNLVRFRSAPGSAREIGALFIAMGTGLMTGMGYLGYSILFTLILGAAMMLYNAVSFRPGAGGVRECTLHITIPEDLDYTGVFDPVLDEYTRRYSLIQVKTTNMGSLFKLTYDLTLKNPAQQKSFIDQLRLRNGNLEISLGHQDNAVTTL